MADERVFAAQGQDLPLDEGALDVVVLKHLVLLQALDRVERVVRVAQLGQNYLLDRTGVLRAICCICVAPKGLNVKKLKCSILVCAKVRFLLFCIGVS